MRMLSYQSAASVMRKLSEAGRERGEEWTQKLSSLCEALLCGRTE